ncbi:putative Ankyrin repeats (3 copies) [Trypanosoma vivax]|uniref:Putative ankyrin repeat protein n=1 Tax=Trypanosoma vivax (strain Y486) TaxID=1055687 RepID=G0U8C3_TRYVY|nr:putative Ankyrin repeats (3 copies) [Trypanosoma vivax]CCC53846.1 putative ankyrin repeat protein [Trypanosoma vivax Y486]
MPYPHVLQCRESSREATRVKYDVSVTTDGVVLRSPPANSKCVIQNIFTAACDGDVPAIQMFLLRGDDINSWGRPAPNYGTTFNRCSHFQATPLCFAAAYGREKAVSMLLSAGADPMKPSTTGVRPLEYAKHRSYAAIVEMLMVAEREQHNQPSQNGNSNATDVTH